MKGFRKSLKGGDRQPAPVSGNGVVSPKSSLTIAPPKKVIRAIRDYVPQSSRELAFSKGDFFHVIGAENDPDWYEACNPATNMRGIVPVDHFEVLGKTVGGPMLNTAMAGMNLNDNRSGNYDGYGNGPSMSPTSTTATSSKASTPVYGVVQYDFVAEQKDELNATAGESIIVIAQSNHEWFVCKPIGRLGGPGLIPISFIEIRDVATGKAVENIEEFVAKSGVPKVEEWKKKMGDYKSKSIPLGQFDFGPNPTNGPPSAGPSPRQSNSQINGNGYAALHSPTTLLAIKDARIKDFSYTNGRYWFWVRAVMEDGRHRNLCRYYEDFYNFQIQLLATFPVESGSTGRDRILPFIPGPTQYVTDAIALERKEDLDVYVRELCLLPPHIINHELVKSFFAPREGDVESGRATNMAPQPSFHPDVTPRASQVSQKRVSSPSQRPYNPRESDTAQIPRTQPLARVGSSPTGAPPTATIGMTKTQTEPTRKYSSSNLMSSGSQPNESPQESQYPSSRQAPPYIKIKIFFQDDIIVIRTPPDVTYDHLIEKMTERLGKPFNSVRFRDSLSNELFDITNNEELRAALQATDKLVLIAD